MLKSGDLLEHPKVKLSLETTSTCKEHSIRTSLAHLIKEWSTHSMSFTALRKLASS